MGSSLADLKAGGMAAIDAFDAGFTPAQMAQVGYAADGGANSIGGVLAVKKGEGMTAGEASAKGFSPAAQKAADFTPEEVVSGLEELKKQEGYTAQKAKDADRKSVV